MKTQVILFILLGFLSMNIAFAQGKLETSIRNFYVALDAGDVDKASTYLAPDFKFSVPVSPVPVDIQGWKQIATGFKVGLPDYQHKVVEGVESKNTFAFKAWFTGTNSGSMMGNPPTGNRIDMPFSGYAKFNDAGKVTELSILFDLAGFNAQLMKGIPSPQDMNKQLVQKVMEALNKHDLDAVTAFYAPGARFNGWAPQQLDVNGYKQAMSALLASFPDARFVIDDLVAEGDKIVMRHHLEGTHSGAAFQGVPASNKRVIATATATFQIKDGKPVELWLNADFLGLLVQIGGVPSGK